MQAEQWWVTDNKKEVEKSKDSKMISLKVRFQEIIHQCLSSLIFSLWRLTKKSLVLWIFPPVSLVPETRAIGLQEGAIGQHEWWVFLDFFSRKLWDFLLPFSLIGHNFDNTYSRPKEMIPIEKVGKYCIPSMIWSSYFRHPWQIY